MKVYFDNAATTPLAKEVIDTMYETSKSVFGNPSSTHSFGRTSRAAIEKARKTIAKYLNVSPLEIVFTSCGTESNNMVLKMATEKYDVKNIIVSEVEHKCVLNTAIELCENKNLNLVVLKVDQFGRINFEELENVLTKCKGKSLVSLMHANNEIGTITDLNKLGNICRKYDAFFHSDTVQTIAHYPFDLNEVNIDFLSGSAHKFHGPKGVGFLYMKQTAKLKPLINGGGQERTYRSGTENLLSIIAMEKALEVSLENMEIWRNHITEIKTYFKERLLNEFDDIQFNGDPENSLYTVLSVSFPENFGSDMFLFNLDIQGIAASGGSACTSGANAGSHVMQAIKHDDCRQAIRFSFAHNNTKEEVDYVIEVLKSI